MRFKAWSQGGLTQSACSGESERGFRMGILVIRNHPRALMCEWGPILLKLRPKVMLDPCGGRGRFWWGFGRLRPQDLQEHGGDTTE